MGQPGSKRTPEASRDICPEAGMVCKGIVDFVLTSQTITLVQLYNLLLSMHFISPHEKKMLQKSYDDTTIAGILAGTPISLLYLAVGVWYIIQWLLFESLEAPVAWLKAPVGFGESWPKPVCWTPLVMLLALLQKELEGQLTPACVTTAEIMFASAREAPVNNMVPTVSRWMQLVCFCFTELLSTI